MVTLGLYFNACQQIRIKNHCLLSLTKFLTCRCTFHVSGGTPMSKGAYMKTTMHQNLCFL